MERGDQRRKRRRANLFHRYVANPITRHFAGHVPGQALLETTGRRSGVPRRTPIGGRLEGGTFWLVSNHGRHAQYVQNLLADPTVRLQVGGRWHSGTATPVDGDDPRARLKALPAHNSAIVRRLGTDLLTIRIDLDT